MDARQELDTRWHGHRQRGRSFLGAVTMSLAVLFGGAASNAAGTKAGGSERGAAASMDGNMMMAPGHWSSSKMREHVDHWLDRVNATPEQRTRIHGILDRVRPQLQSASDDWHRDMQQLRTAMTGQTVDRKLAEQARQDAARVFDRASTTMTGVFADMSEVLTPAQRTQLGQQLSQARQERRSRMHEGRAGGSPTHPQAR
jgi:Spy/CpxP family protein refolding chaperone